MNNKKKRQNCVDQSNLPTFQTVILIWWLIHNNDEMSKCLVAMTIHTLTRTHMLQTISKINTKQHNVQPKQNETHLNLENLLEI